MVSTSGSQILLIGLMLIGIFAWIKPLQKSHQNCPLELNPPPILNTSNFSQENVKETLTKWGGKLKDVFAGKNLNPSCKVVTYGNDWGRHHLCETNMGKPCFFYSFGISYDFSFDVDVHNSMGCKGIGFDPTVSHPSTLSEGVLFLPMGAKTLDPEDTAEFLLVTSIPAFRKEHQHDLAVLKMDCEGCEYSIARDVELGDRTFWFHVQQFAVEIHVSKRWVKTDAHIYYLALLFHQLEEAGLVLSGGEQTSCSPSDESLGCPELLLEVDFPCQPKGMCLNFFFARV